MRYPLALLFALLLVGLAMPTLALSYSFALLGDLGGGGSEARDINDSRQVAGDSDLAGGGWSAFRWEGGVMTDLPELPGYSLSSARGINSSGAVTGSTRASSPYSEHSTVWSGGSLTDLGTLGGSFSTGDGINSAGDVAGSGWLSDGRNRGYVWDSSTGTTTVLSPLGTGDHCWALDLNDSGLVAGYSQHTNGDYGTHAYVWDGTTMTDLASPTVTARAKAGRSTIPGWLVAGPQSAMATTVSCGMRGTGP